MHVSSDNGSNWTAIINGLSDPYVQAAVMYQDFIIAGCYYGISYSSDFGSSWVIMSDSLPCNDIRSLAISGNYIYAGTEGCGIWKRFLPEIVKAPVTSETNNLCIYPNPANEKITITNIDNPSKEAIISIFNITGQQIMSEKFQIQDKIELDVSKFAKGIYILKIQIGSKIENKKLIVQ